MARSGETEDAFILHLVLATNAGQFKVGSFSRRERMVKWNEIFRIQRVLGAAAAFRDLVSLALEEMWQFPNKPPWVVYFD